ncbi:oxamate carbamoyltransferase subunit AllG family protein [Streptomyces sp. NPDC004227]
MTATEQMLNEPMVAVNVGLAGFADPVRAAGAEVVSLDWRPPAEGDAELGWRLAGLVGDAEIDAANRRALERVQGTQPLWVDVRPAREVIPELGRNRLLLHAGPPIEWGSMCGPMKAAVVGAALLEGWAHTPDEAESLAARGDIEFAPCHDFDAVGPMAGIISASQPLMVVEDAASGSRSYSNLNEGRGRCLRYGALGDDVMTRLRWMGERLGPSLQAAVRSLPEPVNLKSVIAQALQMGDECHSRNVAASALLGRRLSAVLALRADLGGIEALEFLATNDYWFLNFSMAASKLAMMAGHGIARSTLVTTYARNGVEVGLRVSGTGDTWFTAPAPVVDGLYFPGYGPENANPDIGDSAITEVFGLGGFALAAAPAIVGFVGGSPRDAIRTTEEMASITLSRHRELQVPSLDFAGSPVGIDLRAVLDSGVRPTITTGIAHREPGIGQIGAGITRMPLACFVDALKAFPDRPKDKL